MDGTYRVGFYLGNLNISNPYEAGFLLGFISAAGDRPNDFFRRVSASPQNTSQTQTPCERKLAGMFGGPDAIMRTRYDANGVYRGEDPIAAMGAISRVARNGMPKDYDPIWDSEHLYNSPHLSGNMAGTANTEIFVPAGYQGQPTRPTPNGGVVLINYAHLGNLNNVTLAIYHVGNFGVQPAGDRVRIGTTGGPGGADAGNFHSHFEIWNGRYRDVVDGQARFARRLYPFTSTFCP